MKNVSRVEYLPKHNGGYLAWSNRIVRFIENIGNDKIGEIIGDIIEGVDTQGGDDVSLGAFFCFGGYLEIDERYYNFGHKVMNLLVFPRMAEVSRYLLNGDGQFLSDYHRDMDPTFIAGIRETTPISRNCAASELHFSRRDILPNYISTALLFKKDILSNSESYPGLKDLLEVEK